jgi:RNase P subunit RPR2
MTDATPRLPTCPDCGGILHPIRAERLTIAEVASADDEAQVLVCQCLICGYTEARPFERPSDERPALA